MKRFDKLTGKVAAIAAAKEDEINALETTGPRGGTNAAYISGWSVPGIAVLTRAVYAAGIPTLAYWSGSAPTPSTAIPTCIVRPALRAVAEVYSNTASGAEARRLLAIKEEEK